MFRPDLHHHHTYTHLSPTQYIRATGAARELYFFELVHYQVSLLSVLPLFSPEIDRAFIRFPLDALTNTNAVSDSFRASLFYCWLRRKTRFHHECVQLMTYRTKQDCKDCSVHIFQDRQSTWVALSQVRAGSELSQVKL